MHRILSAWIERAESSAINFDRLSELELPAVFEGFDLRRKKTLTKTGIFKPIEPFGYPESA